MSCPRSGLTLGGLGVGVVLMAVTGLCTAGLDGSDIKMTTNRFCIANASFLYFSIGVAMEDGT